MGIASFLFGREVSRTEIGSFLVDCTISMNTELSATVTKNPIQDGSVISDHVSLNPLIFKIDGFISESPIGGIGDELNTIAGGVIGGLAGAEALKVKAGGAALAGTGLGAAAGNLMGGGLGKFLPGDLQARDKAAQYPRIAMKALIKSYESRQPFTIRTFFHREEKNNLYSSMVITSLNFPQTSENGNGLKFSMTCEKIKIVSLVTGTASGEFIQGVQAANSAEKKADLGKQATEETKDQTKRNSSTLFRQIKSVRPD